VHRSYRQRLVPAAIAASLLHAAAAVLGVFLLRHAGRTVTGASIAPEAMQHQIVWIAQAGPGGGGGGGGNRMKDPPRPVQAPGKDAFTVPVTKPPALEASREAKNEPNPVERLDIPAEALAASRDSLPGALDGPPAPSASQGPGSGGGAENGTGSALVRAWDRVLDPAGTEGRTATPTGSAAACRAPPRFAEEPHGTRPMRCERASRGPCSSSVSCRPTARVPTFACSVRWSRRSG
jgi:hypothetical protein